MDSDAKRVIRRAADVPDSLQNPEGSYFDYRCARHSRIASGKVSARGTK